MPQKAADRFLLRFLFRADVVLRVLGASGARIQLVRLFLLMEEGWAVSVQDLALLTRMPRPTIYRMVEGLERDGLVGMSRGRCSLTGLGRDLCGRVTREINEIALGRRAGLSRGLLARLDEVCLPEATANPDISTIRFAPLDIDDLSILDSKIVDTKRFINLALSANRVGTMKSKTYSVADICAAMQYLTVEEFELVMRLALARAPISGSVPASAH